MATLTPRRLEHSTIPRRVFDLAQPPTQLYLVGQLPSLPAVAVVGTRKPTAEAVDYTAEFVRALGTAGVAIWSGGAEGIDAAAHRAALAVGAPTVVVAPAGWDRPYPAEHQGLYREILGNGGAYVSLVPPDRAAQTHLFFARNALLVAMVEAVVVVQAGLRSGARNAAKHARRLGRALFAVPSCPWVHQGLGCNSEIRLGARVLTSVGDVLAVVAVGSSDRLESGTERRPSSRRVAAKALGTGTVAERGSPPVHHVKRASLDGELEMVLQAIVAGASGPDQLSQLTGLPVSVVQSDVLRLTLMGLVCTDRSGIVEAVTS